MFAQKQATGHPKHIGAIEIQAGVAVVEGMYDIWVECTDYIHVCVCVCVMMYDASSIPK